jgi:hypothetical protein
MDEVDSKLYRAYALVDQLGLSIANYRRMVQDMAVKIKKIPTNSNDCNDQNEHNTSNDVNAHNDINAT